MNNFDKFIKILQTINKEKPEKADVIVWLQGDRYDRGRKALSLLSNGWSNKVLLSGNNVLVGAKTAKGTDNINLIDMKAWLERKGVPSRQIILDDRSFNTAEQAKNVIRLAIKKRWKKIILVASFYHQPRAFLTFLKSSREQQWRGKIINQPTRVNWTRKPGGRDKTAKALVVEEIKKINNYKLQLASYKEGFKYLNTKEK